MNQEQAINLIVGIGVMFQFVAICYYAFKYQKEKRKFKIVAEALAYQIRKHGGDDKKENSGVSVEVTCLCGKTKFWIADGMDKADPCPKCGRRYHGVYNPKTLTIDAVEVEMWQNI